MASEGNIVCPYAYCNVMRDGGCMHLRHNLLEFLFSNFVILKKEVNAYSDKDDKERIKGLLYLHLAGSPEESRKALKLTVALYLVDADKSEANNAMGWYLRHNHADLTNLMNSYHNKSSDEQIELKKKFGPFLMKCAVPSLLHL